MFSRLANAVTAFQDPTAMEGPSESHVYKQLYVDLQLSQLQVSREYQTLFQEKEQEIRALKQQLNGESSMLSTTSSLESPTKAPPMRDLSAEDVKVIIKEWERKMKSNII